VNKAQNNGATLYNHTSGKPEHRSGNHDSPMAYTCGFVGNQL